MRRCAADSVVLAAAAAAALVLACDLPTGPPTWDTTWVVAPLRVGAAWVTDGYTLTGGAGLETGVVNLGASLGVRHSDVEDALIFAVTLSFGGR